MAAVLDTISPALERNSLVGLPAEAELRFYTTDEGRVVPGCVAAIFAHKCIGHRPCTFGRKEKTDAGGMFIGTNATRRATNPRRTRMTLETGHLGP